MRCKVQHSDKPIATQSSHCVPETDGTQAFDHWLHRMAACNAELKPGMNPAAIAVSGLGWRKPIYNMDLLQLPKMSKFIYSTVFIPFS